MTLATIEEIPVEKEHDVVWARVRVKAIAESLGFDNMDQTRIATAVSELSRNIIRYAGKGKIAVYRLRSPEGIKVVAEDHGPGIEDIELAMKDGYSTSGGLGYGLPGTKRLMDDFKIWSKPGKGTKITIEKWRRR